MTYLLLLFFEIPHLLNFNRLFLSTSNIQFMIPRSQIEDLWKITMITVRSICEVEYLSTNGRFAGIECKCCMFLTGEIKNDLKRIDFQQSHIQDYFFIMCRNSFDITPGEENFRSKFILFIKSDS